MALHIYNVRPRKERSAFEEGRVNMYVRSRCMITHVGYKKTYLSFDVVVRYLRFRGLRAVSRT